MELKLKGIRLTGRDFVNGRIATTAKALTAISELGMPVIFVRNMTLPEDVPTMRRAAAVVTSQGGPTCHAAIVCRALNIPCMTGVSNMIVNSDQKIVATHLGERHVFTCGSKATVGLTELTLKGEDSND